VGVSKQGMSNYLAGLWEVRGGVRRSGFEWFRLEHWRFLALFEATSVVLRKTLTRGADFPGEQPMVMPLRMGHVM